jgi:hypothetical protein
LKEKEKLPISQKEGTVRKRLIHVIRYSIQLAGKLVCMPGRGYSSYMIVMNGCRYSEGCTPGFRHYNNKKTKGNTLLFRG